MRDKCLEDAVAQYWQTPAELHPVSGECRDRILVFTAPASERGRDPPDAGAVTACVYAIPSIPGTYGCICRCLQYYCIFLQDIPSLYRLHLSCMTVPFGAWGLGLPGCGVGSNGNQGNHARIGFRGHAEAT